MHPTRREILGGAGASLVLGSLGCSILWPDSGSGKDLIPRQDNPFCGEPRLDRLVESWITPFRHFFVRSHGTIPNLDPGTWSLIVGGDVERSVRFSLEELEKFPQAAVQATIHCAENRRGDFHRLKPVEGIPWDAGAVATAEWRGVRVADLLARAGVKPSARYAWFDGLDAVTLKDRQTVFGGQVPLERALRPETIVAIEMNGSPLSREHGYPARAIVPGCIGAHSVKWLGRIVASEKTSENVFVAREHKVLPPAEEAQKLRPEDVEPITENVLNSAICRPRPGQTVAAGRLEVRGYAVPPGAPGVTVAAVEVSPDGGATWAAARLSGKDAPSSWSLWTCMVEVAAGARTLVVRATDSKGGMQPERAAWNPKGLLCNSWHRVPITVA